MADRLTKLKGGVFALPISAIWVFYRFKRAKEKEPPVEQGFLKKR